MTPKTKTIIRNVLVTPFVLFRLFTILPLSFVCVAGRWANNMCDLADEYIPRWNRFPLTKEELEERQKKFIEAYTVNTQTITK